MCFIVKTAMAALVMTVLCSLLQEWIHFFFQVLILSECSLYSNDLKKCGKWNSFRLFFLQFTTTQPPKRPHWLGFLVKTCGCNCSTSQTKWNRDHLIDSEIDGIKSSVIGSRIDDAVMLLYFAKGENLRSRVRAQTKSAQLQSRTSHVRPTIVYFLVFHLHSWLGLQHVEFDIETDVWWSTKLGTCGLSYFH